MDPSTTLLSSAFDHLPPLPQPNLDGTIWETFECLRLANQEYAVFQPHPHRRGFFGTFHCAIRPLKKKPTTDRLTKIIFCFCHTLRDHILFIKQANEDRVFFREQTGSDLVVHLASVVATMSAHTPHLPLPQNRTPSILPHERIQRPPDRPSELERRLIRPKICPKYALHEFHHQAVFHSRKPHAVPATPLGQDKEHSLASLDWLIDHIIFELEHNYDTDFYLHDEADAQSSSSSLTHFSHTKPPTLPQPTPTYLSHRRL